MDSINYKNNTQSKIPLVLFLSLILPLLFGFTLGSIDFSFASITLHSVMEASGGILAFLISIVFIMKNVKTAHINKFYWSAIALTVMGLLDLFHALTSPSTIFIWLHSLAVFSGGVLFMLVWIKELTVKKTIYFLIPIFFIIVSFITGIFSGLFESHLPSMQNSDKSFTLFANLLNLIGAIGFLIASKFFYNEYKNDKTIENLLLFGLTLLFASSGFLFFSSVIWDLQWWFWHTLRLIAYSLTLYFLVNEFSKRHKFVSEHNDQLIEANNKLETYFEIIDKNVVTSATDLKGYITDVSSAFCTMTGYNREELIGKKHDLLRSPNTKKELYTSLWTTLQKNETWKGEIENIKKDGSFFWIKVTINPVYDDENQKIGYSSIREDITDKKKIEKLSVTDPLTNIGNRRYYENTLPKFVNSARRENKIVSYAIIDIDHFKQFNDNYGHKHGDLVLEKVAQKLSHLMKRSNDFVFRIGGEEFCVLFDSEDEEKAFQFAQTIITNIEDLEIEHNYNSASDYITISMGIMIIHASQIDNPEFLYKKADALLYLAKKKGRNRVISNKCSLTTKD